MTEFLGLNRASSLTEAEEIKEKWQEYTEDLYKKKFLMTQITVMVWSLT